MKKLIYIENSQGHRWIGLFEALGALMALGLISSTVKMVTSIELRSYGNGGGKNKN